MLDASLRQLQRATAERPDDPQAWVRLGRALGRAGRAVDGMEAFYRAREIDPGDAEARVGADPSPAQIAAVRTVARVPTGNATAFAVAFSPDGTRLAVGGSSRSVVLLDVATWREEAVCALGGHDTAVHFIAFSPDGRRLASAGRYGRPLIWELDEPGAPGVETDRAGPRRLEARVRLGDEDVPRWGLLFSPDGDHVLTGAGGPEINVWNAATGGLLCGLYERPIGKPLRCLAVSPGLTGGGPILATAAADGSVHLHDLATGVTLADLGGHDAEARGLAFARHGRWLVSGAVDGSVIVWDVMARQALRRLAPSEVWGSGDGDASPRRVPPRLTAIGASPGGRVIAVQSASGQVRLLHLGADATVGSVAGAPDLAGGFGVEGALAWDPATILLAQVQGGLTVFGIAG